MYSTRNTKAREMFITGPAIEISPNLSLGKAISPNASLCGYITAAPGAAKTMPISDPTSAIIKPAGYITYSAWQPNLLARKR